MVHIPSSQKTSLLLLIITLLFYSQWFYLLLSFLLGHSHSFLATILLNFFAPASQFSLALLSNPVLPAWCFLFFSLCLLRKFTSLPPSLASSSSWFLQSFPYAHCGLFSSPFTSLFCKPSLSLLISDLARYPSQLRMSLQPQEPQPWEGCLQTRDKTEKNLC